MPRPRWSNWSNAANTTSDASFAASASQLQQPYERITPLLDYESLTSILFLIFPHEYRIYNTRLQRIIRSLCVHVSTRDWIIKSLISVLNKCHSNDYLTLKQHGTHRPVWLGIKVDPSINSTANMFSYNEHYVPGQPYCEIPINIHPQSVTPICCEVLDHLIPIAKIYPLSFLPLKRKKHSSYIDTESTNTNNEKMEYQNFWDILIQIDNTSFKRKMEGKNPFMPSTSSKKCKFSDEFITYKSFEDTPFGKLIQMLSYCKNKFVTGKLLRLLSLISTGLGFEEKNKMTLDSKGQTSYIVDKTLLPTTESQLKIIVHTLTESTGTADGLEEFLILNLCKCSVKTRLILYKLLIDSVKDLALKVEKNILSLMTDLEQFSQDNTRLETSMALSFSLQNIKGTLHDRFTNESVVVNSFSGNVQPKSSEIQLPSMGPLTSKQSSQAKFLRVLKVVIKIKECVKNLQGSSAEVSLDEPDHLTPLSDILKLNVLWETLSNCLIHLEKTADHYAVLVLQPAVEAFFLVHASSQTKPTSNTPVQLSIPNNTEKSVPNDNESLQPLSPIINSEETSASLDQKKFLHFAEKHRTVLNQILRQSSSHLADGPFSCLVDHARILDFDVKRRFFRTELERLDEGVRREELAVHVHRVTVFEDSFRELYRRSHEEWKNRFYIVFEGNVYFK